MDYYDILISVLGSTIRLSIPLIFTALAGLFSERAGVFDIGLEGKMLAAAFAAACMATVTGSAWAGLGAGIVVSVTFGLLHGFASITNRGNQIVSGVAINFLIAGLTVVLGQAWFGQGGRTPQLGADARFVPIILPGADAMRGVPIIGPLYANVISGNNILTYIAFLAVPISWWILYRTRFGLRLRAVGENPGAVDTAGISVAWLRYRSLICAGILCGFSGTYLAIAQSAGFIANMSAGKGYIALAALIFAKWKPVPVMLSCLLFGFLDAFSNFMQGKSVPGIGEVPVQIFQALPYILTCILLAGFIGVAKPPKAGGVPYTKER
ncbi:ABC transporter permease [Agrobacterium rhizogenes]|uniref:Sugar ABC transporter n=1 Tax=Rhizobium rhizogenes (strain K84 / ATCC BAA-868) TaxID=311403 RepID=B9J6V1_RHIR8|nr:MULTISPECIES: ABC transporter permease [Rhizobium]ACM25057.1 sugar ABC transporter [Rhizobium rhizogenes K84]OCJ03932.1 sugar ABC transporter permease [Agrobacterium sp. 13-626]OCJ21419.1 sugar ABC transporter permease [Agrobacterium sp. B131/95]EJK79316.1 putative ABC-type transport system, permease component [Rhizobium sp. AP16]KEA04843.1 sugar ABC transporter permease [Rhizobium rhizogenes]